MRRLTSVKMSYLLTDTMLSSSLLLSSRRYIVRPDHRLVIITLLQYKYPNTTYGQYIAL